MKKVLFPRKVILFHYLCKYEDRVQSGTAQLKNSVFICPCAHLSLSLQHES
ncbi:conserved domain protein [Paraprevotella xylaniphila YIT 11841]|uniref:Conserved domain protein n=1 Tax=Paraprevotella xylaniphila YIT 11841 TaxID=762982 RepID=F3QT32_9BACT|nr:conserved domain protein [Paraprevotella xylaniphila YIT 11841]